MIYRSNLVAPDLTPYFKLTQFDHFGGHTFLADPDFDPRCGFFTHDEAALLYNVAVAVTRMSPGPLWLDIGARTGWTAAHLIAAGACVVALEPEYYLDTFRLRALENVGPVRHKYASGTGVFLPWSMRSREYFAQRSDHARLFDGVIIDGNHDEPEPLIDAQHSYKASNKSAVFVIHDFLGPATWQAAEYLLNQGCRCRVYWTPNCTAVCVRGFYEWQLPEHRPDPQLERAYRPRIPKDLLARCQ